MRSETHQPLCRVIWPQQASGCCPFACSCKQESPQGFATFAPPSGTARVGPRQPQPPRRFRATGRRPARSHAGFGLTERRRSRTDRAVGYTTAQVLKTCWATGPVPLRGHITCGFGAPRGQHQARVASTRSLGSVLDHVGIAVSDLAASERFYRTVVFPRWRRAEPRGRRARRMGGLGHGPDRS